MSLLHGNGEGGVAGAGQRLGRGLAVPAARLSLAVAENSIRGVRVVDLLTPNTEHLTPNTILLRWSGTHYLALTS